MEDTDQIRGCRFHTRIDLSRTTFLAGEQLPACRADKRSRAIHRPAIDSDDLGRGRVQRGESLDQRR